MILCCAIVPSTRGKIDKSKLLCSTIRNAENFGQVYHMRNCWVKIALHSSNIKENLITNFQGICRLLFLHKKLRRHFYSFYKRHPMISNLFFHCYKNIVIMCMTILYTCKLQIKKLIDTYAVTSGRKSF